MRRAQLPHAEIIARVPERDPVEGHLAVPIPRAAAEVGIPRLALVARVVLEGMTRTTHPVVTLDVGAAMTQMIVTMILKDGVTLDMKVTG